MIEMAKVIRLGGLTIQYQTDEVLGLWIEAGFQIRILIYISYLELLIRQISYQNRSIVTICNYKYSPLSIIDKYCKASFVAMPATSPFYDINYPVWCHLPIASQYDIMI